MHEQGFKSKPTVSLNQMYLIDSLANENASWKHQLDNKISQTRFFWKTPKWNHLQ